MKSWKEIHEWAKKTPTITISVAKAEDEVVLKALYRAKKENIIKAILVGDENKIRELLSKLNIPESEFEIVNASDDKEAAKLAVKLIKDKKAEALMKGMISTSTLLKAVLDKENGLRKGSLLSHIMVAEARGKLYLITDGGMNMYPDVKTLSGILDNAVYVAKKMGIETPKVAVLGAVEVVNPDMPATINAAMLSKINNRKQIKDCLVDGPLALDNAVSIEAAKHKKIESDVAGDADILLVPDIEAGNILGKSMIYFAKAQAGGIIAGASAPIILLSRADNDETKFNSICLSKVIGSK